jgi:biopolymer transport protein ExbD
MSGIFPSRPRRARRVPFMLTPLIDVMFLLLIFFMLSSQLSPFSLLPLGRVAGDVPDTAPASTAVSGGIADLSVRVGANRVTIGGEAVEMTALAAKVRDLIGQGVGGFVVVATRAASVQDIVSTLEALQLAGAERVTLVNAGAGG